MVRVGSTTSVPRTRLVPLHSTPPRPTTLTVPTTTVGEGVTCPASPWLKANSIPFEAKLQPCRHRPPQEASHQQSTQHYQRWRTLETSENSALKDLALSISMLKSVWDTPKTRSWCPFSPMMELARWNNNSLKPKMQPTRMWSASTGWALSMTVPT